MKKKPEKPNCMHCGKISRLTDGFEVYPHRRDLHEKSFYVCTGCESRVGCHPGSVIPLGRPANAALRIERSKTHAVIDPFWKQAPNLPCYGKDLPRKARAAIKAKARNRIYKFLRREMKITAEEAHIGMFDVDQCRAARALFYNITYEQIREMDIKAKEAEHGKNSGTAKPVESNGG